MFTKKRITTGKQLLHKILLSGKNEKEMEDLLSSLLTPTEYETLSERSEIIRALLEGKTQRNISEETGSSLATISRGSREIKFGNGIFQKIFERL